MVSIQHQAGRLVDLVQSCTRCGVTLADYRNAMAYEAIPRAIGFAEDADVFVCGRRSSTIAPGGAIEVCLRPLDVPGWEMAGAKPAPPPPPRTVAPFDLHYQLCTVKLNLARIGPDTWLFLEYPSWPLGRTRWAIHWRRDLEAFEVTTALGLSVTNECALELIPKEIELAKQAIEMLRTRSRS